MDDAVCEEMDRHIDDCAPCQAFLSSLQQAVAQCRSYAPRCESPRAEALRRELVVKYQQAVAALERKKQRTSLQGVTFGLDSLTGLELLPVSGTRLFRQPNFPVTLSPVTAFLPVARCNGLAERLHGSADAENT